MQQWLLLAQDLSHRLKTRCAGAIDHDLRSELGQVIELIELAEMEFGEGERADNAIPRCGTIIGQCGNISKIFSSEEIAYCQSDDKKVFIIDSDYKYYRTSSSLKEIEALMGSLVRINQSTLINFAQVKTLEYRDDMSHYAIKLINNVVFRVSRRCAKKVRDIFNSQHGAELLVS